MTTEPLDVEGLLGELGDRGSEPFDGLPGGTTMGHVHLELDDFDSTVGFSATCSVSACRQLGDSAAFLPAPGYHHHLGANTWESRALHRRRPAPPRSATPPSCCRMTPLATAPLDRLDRGSATWPTRTSTARSVSDPSGNPLVL